MDSFLFCDITMLCHIFLHFLQQALIKMYGEWDDLSFNFVAYKDTGVKILSAVEDIQVSSECQPLGHGYREN